MDAHQDKQSSCGSAQQLLFSLPAAPSEPDARKEEPLTMAASSNAKPTAEFKAYDQAQSLLFPPNVADFLPDDHPARVLNDIVDALDLSSLEVAYSRLGQHGYPPRALIKLWFYGYSVGIRASRQLQRAIETNVAFMYLAGGLRPDFRTLADFRSKNFKAFCEIFAQVVHICESAGMILLKHVSIDGVRMKANASRKKTRDGKKLQEELKQIQDELEKLVAEGQRLDQEEDEALGENCRGDEIPEDLKDKKKREELIRHRLAELEKSKASKINLTDPDATFQKVDGKLKPGYNAQASVDAHQQVVVSCDVTTDADDCAQLIPGIEGVKENTGRYPDQTSADGAYNSGPNLETIDELELDVFMPDREQAKKNKMPEEKRPYHRDEFIYDPENDCYICPKGEKLMPSGKDWKDPKDHSKGKVQVYRGTNCQNCDVFELCRQNKNAKARTVRRDEYEELRQAHRAKMNTPEAEAAYSLRQYTVEPVFGNIKHNLGYRDFLLRGRDKVKGEFAIMCTVHNLLKLLLQARLKGGIWLELVLQTS